MLVLIFRSEMFIENRLLMLFIICLFDFQRIVVAHTVGVWVIESRNVPSWKPYSPKLRAILVVRTTWPMAPRIGKVEEYFVQVHWIYNPLVWVLSLSAIHTTTTISIFIESPNNIHPTGIETYCNPIGCIFPH